RFRPIHGILAVLAVLGVGLFAELALEGRLGKGSYERVSPGADHMVRIDVARLNPLEVRFYRFLNSSNQEIKFFVGKDAGGVVQVAFDASEVCAKGKRGFRPQGEWVVCNKCDKAFRLASINNGGGGCEPVPVAHHEEGGQLVLAEADVLTGWRLFH